MRAALLSSPSEATGDVAATRDVQTHKLDGMPDGGVGCQLFVVPYRCADNMSFTAR